MTQQGVADGIGALRLLVVLGLVVDAASTFSDLRLADVSLTAAAVPTVQLVLAAAAAAAVMWLRWRLAVVLCTAVVLLALTVGPTSEELWLLLVVAVTVGARASLRTVAAVAAAQLGYVVFFALGVEQRSRGWGLRAAALAAALCLLGYAAGFLARRYLNVLESRRLRLRELEQENAQIRATERLRLADDLQVVVTGGLTTIQGQLDGLVAHTDDAVRLRRGLTAIDHASRSVLAELRALLEILRRDPVDAETPRDDLSAERPRRWIDVLTARRVRLAAAAAFSLLALQAALDTSGERFAPSTVVELLGWTACAVVVCQARTGAALALAALVVSIMLGTPTDWSVLPVVVLFFLAALRAGARRLWLVVVALLGYGGLLVVTASSWPLALTTAGYAGVLAILGGLAAGQFLDAGRDSVRRHAGLLDDRDRLGTQERAAVARDLHDVVAHQLSLTNLSIMSTSASTDPAKLRATLQRVAESVHAADGELFELLHEMRGQVGGVQTTPLVLPSAGAESFARQLAANGFEPVMEMDPEADELDVTTMRTLGRTMQEATTNIVRYAPVGSTCRYTLDVAEDRVRLTVVSSLSVRERRSTLSLGWGLRGIAERVELSHGRFTAGPHGGSWLVEVTLPRAGDRKAASAAALVG